ncbi:MAG: MXAN_5187 C-terminal domain-containing protein, partial [Anaeromyxobacteraceae bacterium]
QIDARLQLLASDAAQLADAVARDPAFAQATAPEAGRDAAAAAQAALQARQAPGADRPVLVAVSTRAGVTARAAGAPVQLEADGASMVSGAAEVRRAGYVQAEEALWYLAAAPAGQGAAAGVGLPLDATWLGAVRNSTTCNATLAIEGRKPVTTLSPAELAVVLGAAKNAIGRTASAGALGAQQASFDAPVKIPALSMPFSGAPAYRIRAIPVRGVTGAAIVLSAATAPLLAPIVSYLWIALAAVALLFILGVLTGFGVTNEQRAVVPKDLVGAADRIGRGDFAARAPALAGSLGTVAAALNRAAEAAQVRPAAVAPAAVAPAAGPTQGFPVPARGVSAAPAFAEAAPPDAPEPAPVAAPQADPFAFPQREAAPPEAQREPTPPPADEVTAVVRPIAEPPPAEPARGAEPAEAEAPALLAQASIAAEPQGSEPSPTERFAPSPTERFEPAAPSAGSPATPPAAATPPPFADALPNDGADDGVLRAIRSDAAHHDAGTEDLFPLGRSPVDARPADRLAAPAEAAPRAVAAPPPPAPQPAAGIATGGVSAADEAHWRTVYDEFVRVRAECGEGPQAVAFDRFRLKLLKNREQLLEKYRCRTVKFQVYVKDGKAALKATPVR